jgi:peptidoglycan/xylan/chitin deacetylase (PgdA/CDA1 family)
MLLVEEFCQELGCEFIENNVLEWKELQELAAQGVTLAAHTRTHPLLNRVSPAVARAEITGSFNDLCDRIGHVESVFAYPSGGLNDRVVDILREEGFSLAFTTQRGVNDLDQVDPLRLRRINVGVRTTDTALRSQLLAWCVIANCLHRRRFQRMKSLR